MYNRCRRCENLTLS